MFESDKLCSYSLSPLPDGHCGAYFPVTIEEYPRSTTDNPDYNDTPMPVLPLADFSPDPSANETLDKPDGASNKMLFLFACVNVCLRCVYRRVYLGRLCVIGDLWCFFRYVCLGRLCNFAIGYLYRVYRVVC